MTMLVGIAQVVNYRKGAFLRGAAAAFDVRGNSLRFFRNSSSAAEADRKARLNDLEVVLADRQQARAISDS